MLNAHNRALSISLHFKVSFVGFSTLSVSEVWERNLIIELSVKTELTFRNNIYFKPNGNIKEKTVSWRKYSGGVHLCSHHPHFWRIRHFLGLNSSGPSLWKSHCLFRFIGKWIIHGTFSIFFLNLWDALKFATYSPLTHEGEIREKTAVLLLCNVNPIILVLIY